MKRGSRGSSWAVAAALLVVLGACAGEASDDAIGDEPLADLPPAAAGDPAPAGVVDSVFPMEVMIARFREGLDEPAGLEHGTTTRDALVERLVAALQASDTAAFETVAVDRAEFAWLYFPTSPVAQPPYELPPGLAWFRMQEGNRKGVFRALREFGGRTLDLHGYQCPAEPQVEGANRVWVGCVVQIAREGETVSLRLFESILERDGRFAVLSYANDF